MILIQMESDVSQNFTYLIGDEKTGLAAVVDPAGSASRIMMKAAELGLKIMCIINTHSHWDHVEGNKELAEKTRARIIMHADAPLKKDTPVKDGDIVKVGSVDIRIIHTPGHCPDEICLLAEGKLFTGDTLFVGECGRTDLPGGNSADMYESLFHKILSLSDDIEVYPGHNYGGKPHSTIGYERRTNYTLQPRSKAEFVKFMAED